MDRSQMQHWRRESDESINRWDAGHGRCMQWISTLRATRRAAASNTPAEAETGTLTQAEPSQFKVKHFRTRLSRFSQSLI